MAKDPKHTDSVEHNEDRHAKLKAESDRLAKEETKAQADRDEKQAVRDMKAEDADAAMLEKRAYEMTDLGTREELLQRVREMRETSPPVHTPPPLSDAMRQQIEVEQEAGRQAVAKAEAEAEKFRQAREAAAADVKAREGEMHTVHQPNPGMDEQYPAQGATLGKKK